MEKLVNDVIYKLESYRNEKRKEQAKTYYPTSMQVIGVVVPDIKKVIKELNKQTIHYNSCQKHTLAQNLVDTNIFECQQVAYEYLGKQPKTLKDLTPAIVYSLGKNLDNWVSVDMYSLFIVGYAWRENLLTTEQIKEYIHSPDVWQRRIAIVSTVALNQKARGAIGDTLRTLEICKLVIDDHKDLINKALSWALRELSKVDRESVIEFLQEYNNRLHSRVKKEVNHKLYFGTKN